MTEQKIENGIQQKIALLREIRKLVWDAPEYRELNGLVEGLINVFGTVDWYLTSITYKIADLRRMDRLATWNSLGEFQGTPGLCDVAIAKATVYLGQLEGLVYAGKVPTASIPLIRQIIWIDEK